MWKYNESGLLTPPTARLAQPGPQRFRIEGLDEAVRRGMGV